MWITKKKKKNRKLLFCVSYINVHKNVRIYLCVHRTALEVYSRTVTVVEWLGDRGGRGVIFHRIFLSNF